MRIFELDEWSLDEQAFWKGEEKRNNQGKDQESEEKTARMGTHVPLKETARVRTQGQQPSSEEVASSEKKKTKGREVEEEEEKDNEEESEAQKNGNGGKKCKESIVSMFTMRRKEDEKEKERRKRDGRPKARQPLGEVWEVALSLFSFGAELVMCQRCGGRTAEKDGGDCKDAAGSSGKRRQIGGGDSAKVEDAKRRRQD